MNLINELLSHFTTPQKTAEEIQAIPQDQKIYVESWDLSKGYLIVDLHYIWWPDEISCMNKDFYPGDFEEFCRAEYPIPGLFCEWWKCWSERMQQKIVENFIAAHEPMIRKELEDYYSAKEGQTP